MTSQSDITKQIRQDMNRQKAIVDADPWRLHYHLMPEVGWLNDPNGAVQFNGTYHIYHQYVPETPNGGRTHWDIRRHKISFTSQRKIFSYHQPNHLTRMGFIRATPSFMRGSCTSSTLGM